MDAALSDRKPATHFTQCSVGSDKILEVSSDTECGALEYSSSYEVNCKRTHPEMDWSNTCRFS